MQEARSRGAAVLALHVATYNVEACALYQRHGFQMLRRHLQFYTFNPARAPVATQTTYDAYLFALPLVDTSDEARAAAGAAWGPTLEGALHGVHSLWHSLVHACAGPRLEAEHAAAAMGPESSSGPAAVPQQPPAEPDPCCASEDNPCAAPRTQRFTGDESGSPHAWPPGGNNAETAPGPILAAPQATESLTAAERDLALYRRLFRRPQR